MTPPTKADDRAPAARRHDSDAPAPHAHDHAPAARKLPPALRRLPPVPRRLRTPLVFVLVFSALALTGLFRLAERVSNARVAAAAVISTALYPVFFAQSSLAHLDMTAAALTLWGLFLYLPPRREEVGASGRAVGAGLVPAR